MVLSSRWRPIVPLLSLAATSLAAAPSPVVWRLDNLHLIGGLRPEIWGVPAVADDGAVRFDGVRDGLVLPADPIAGWRTFTVAVLFRPEAGGPEAQRFLHIEDDRGHRLTVETRIIGGGSWCLDTYLQSGASRRVLLDPTKLHQAGRWAWAELVYDGRTMRSYVNGRQQLSGTVAFPPMAAGRTAIGVRLNRVFWFQGEIREIRFYPSALAPPNLPSVS